MKNNKITFYLVLAALVAALAVALWLFQRGHSKPLPATPPAQSGPPPTLVEAAKVMVDTIPVGITAVGSLRSDETVMLRPEIAGRVSRVLFREGQPVARGQVLIQLDGAVQGAEVQQAQANVTLAQSKLDRARDLQAKGFISQQARDESDNNLRLAQAALSLAQARYAKTEIRAPFNGVAGLRVVSTGDYVKEGQDLVNLEAMDVLKVDFRIPEIYVQQSKVGQSLQLVLDAMPGQTFTGQVIAINPLIDANGRSIVLRAQVQNAQHQLRPGLFARVRLLFADQKEALLVSEQALIPQGDDHMVFRVINGKAVLSRVEIGQRIGERVEVVQGLTKDDMVITAGQVKLRDGMAVTVKQ